MTDKRFFGFLGLKPFVLSLQKLPARAVAVVFDTREKLNELSPITVLDDKPRSIENLFVTVFSQTQGQPIQPVLRKVDHVQAIISTMKSDQFLQVYNTLLYRIGKDNREKVRSTVLLFMGNRLSAQQFDSRMTECLAARPRGPDPVQLLIDLVKSDHGIALRSAVAMVQKGNDADFVASTSTVSAYEIRYTLSYLAKQGR